MLRWQAPFPTKSICTAASQLELPGSTVQKQRIIDAIATNDEAMLQRTRQEVKYGLNVLHVTNGAHIEVY